MIFRHTLLVASFCAGLTIYVAIDKTFCVLLQALGKVSSLCSSLRSGGLGITERIGSNPDYDLSGDWVSTRGNGPQVGGLSNRRFSLGGLL